MTSSEMKSTGRAVMYLSACALRGKCPDRAAVQSMKLEAVYEQAVRHSMVGITYRALVSYVKQYGDGDVGTEMLEKWKKAYQTVFHVLVTMALEREKLTAFMDEQGIWYMPLKGIVLLDCYPSLGMRQMSDNDILINPEKRAEIRDFMLENGYVAEHYGGEHPDTYIGKGNLCFEMHHALFSDMEEKGKIYNYYSDVTNKLVNDGNSGYKRKFSDEDFYIYMLAHAYKHFTASGNGLRSLMDMVVLDKCFYQNADKEYIAAELEKLDMTYYEQTVRSIVGKLFDSSPPPPSEYDTLLSGEENEILDYHIESGVFGTTEIHVRNMMCEFKKKEKISFFTKVKYLLGRLFPNMEYYKLNYPRAYKYKILVPFYWFYRLLGCARNFKKTFAEVKVVAKIETGENDKR